MQLLLAARLGRLEPDGSPPTSSPAALRSAPPRLLLLRCAFSTADVAGACTGQPGAAAAATATSSASSTLGAVAAACCG